MIYLRQNTASQEITLGMFVDSTDGNTEETGLTIANTDIKIRKSGATTLSNKNSGGATHISNGVYYAVLDATDTDTLGSGEIYCHVSGALYCKLVFTILPANVYDSFILGTDYLDVATITNADKTGYTASTVSDKTGYTVSTVSDKTGYSLSVTPPTAADIATAVWGAATRSLTTFGSLVSDIATAVWGAVARTITGGTITTNSDKTGYTLTVTPPTASGIADAVWDEVLTGATHNIVNSAGRKLRQVEADVIITGISPDTGGTANTFTRIELAADASTVSGTYDPGIIYISAGTGVGQSRQIFEYDGANKYAYVNRDWKVIPDNTSEYTIIANSGDTHINEGVATGGGNTTITLNALADASNDIYKGQIVFITAGTGQDQARRITAYNGTSKVATVDTAWITNPVNGSIYVILPTYSADSGGGDATAANQLTIIGHLEDVKGATFSESTDSLEAIRDRGDIAWITGSGLAGSNTVTLTIQDGSGNNIVGAFVEIWDTAGTAFQERKISNASGQAIFNMDDGTWIVKILKSMYSFTNASLVVSGNTSQTYNMTPYVITPPVSPSVCRLYGYFYEPDGTYHATLTGSAEIGIYDSNNNYYSYTSSGVYDVNTGLLYWDVVRGSTALLTISELPLFQKSIVVVPDLATSEIDGL